MYHQLKKIKINDDYQWISVRTNCKNNPLLLYIHGGPGTPELPFFKHYHQLLEDHFMVVNWDQRCAGKSFSIPVKKEKMNISQFVRDLHELTKSLCDLYNKDKIIIMGKSWGTVIGLIAVSKYPNLFHAYIGVSQLTHVMKTEQMMFDFALQQAKKNDDTRTVTQLKTLSKSGPHQEWNYYKNGLLSRMKVYYLVKKFGGIHHNITSTDHQFEQLIDLLSALHPEYNLIDLIKYFFGNLFSVLLLNNELLQVNLFEQVKEVNVPVYFLSGTYDMNCPASLVKDYYQSIKAPKKQLIWFDNSAHSPNREENKKFNETLIKIKKDIFESS